MLRASRRGLADLIVMIVMIVFLVGMSVLAFFAYSKSSTEKQYVARMREKLQVRQRAELDATRAKYAEVSAKIGFKGDSDVSSPKTIRDMLDRGGKVVAAFYSITAANPDERGQVEGTAKKTVPFTINGKAENVDVSMVGKGTERNPENLYDEQGSISLHQAIGVQDNVISQMVGTHNVKVRDQRRKQRDFKDQAAVERKAASDTEYESTKGIIENSNKELAQRAETLAKLELDEAQARKDEVTAYSGLDSPEMRSKRESAFAKLKDTALARQRAVAAQRDLRVKSGKRRYDDTRDTDGFVFLVDQRSGYLWINIGQRQDVRLNQTFQVVRADAGRAGLVQVGEVRVKEVLQGNIARCRVDALDDPTVYPQAGDMVRNPNFSARQYQTFALAGKFGGAHSQHSRQELVDMLLRLGFQVVTKIDGATDAVIIGGDWADDPEYARAKSLAYNFETYTEEDVLYFLGFTGPDAGR